MSKMNQGFESSGTGVDLNLPSEKASERMIGPGCRQRICRIGPEPDDEDWNDQDWGEQYEPNGIDNPENYDLCDVFELTDRIFQRGGRYA